MITALSTLCRSNRPGILQIEYAPVDWINADQWENWLVNGNMTLPIPWANVAYNWLKLPLIGESMRWLENENRSPQGPSYAQRLSGIMPGMDPAVQEELRKHSLLRYIIRLSDYNGRVWIIGSPESPLEMESPASNQTGENDYAIEFTAVAAHRARGFAA